MMSHVNSPVVSPRYLERKAS